MSTCGAMPDDDVNYEYYDPNKPVCDNQDDFNQAFHKALKHNNKKEMKKARPYIYVYIVLWLIFTVWAIILSMRVPPGKERVLHLFFALVAPPAYVLAYYLGAMGTKSNSGMKSYGHVLYG